MVVGKRVSPLHLLNSIRVFVSFSFVIRNGGMADRIMMISSHCTVSFAYRSKHREQYASTFFVRGVKLIGERKEHFFDALLLSLPFLVRSDICTLFCVALKIFFRAGTSRHNGSVPVRYFAFHAWPCHSVRRIIELSIYVEGETRLIQCIHPALRSLYRFFAASPIVRIPLFLFLLLYKRTSV